MQNIVDAKWVLEHLDNVVMIDCRFHLLNPLKGQEEYNSEHITGAYYFDLNKDLSGSVATHGGRHPLPDLKVLHHQLEEVGVSDDIPVVLYDDQNGAMASRLWWLLTALGHQKAYVMSGGFEGWKEQGYPVSASVPAKGRRGTFTADFQQDLIVTAEEVLDRLPSIEKGHSYLIDAREPKRYQGIEEPIDKKAGHIPGALNYFWMDNVSNNVWKEEQALKERFSKLDATKEVIVYCGSGVTACPNILALKEAGFHNVKLYAGSWSDWISYENHPISTVSD